MSLPDPIAAAEVPHMPDDLLGVYARGWLEGNLPENLRTDMVPDVAPQMADFLAWEIALHQAGLAGVTWPVEYGGGGRTLREHLIVSREIGRLPVPESVNSIGKELVGPIIQAVGTPEQKARFLPAILTMKDVWCQGFSEPGAGSDLAALRTRAEDKGGVWLINGQKVWTSAAYRSQRCLLLARVGAVEDRHRGLCLFAVPMDSAGITVKRIKSIDGRENFCEVFFDNVEVDQKDALGSPDEGWSAALRVLSVERATNRMHRAWRFENEVHHLISACKSDPQLAAALASDHYRRRIASTILDVEVLKGHIGSAVDSVLAGDSIGARGSIVKLHWSEAHQRFLSLALDLLSKASLPFTREVKAGLRRFETAYLLARSETIVAGTSEIQLGIIADRIMQLPKGA